MIYIAEVVHCTGKRGVFGLRPVVVDSLHVCTVWAAECVGGIILFDERIVMNSCKC